ncbi:MAG: helix-turn-helix domain-containing protein [Pseudonocardiaceae bacterium]
MDRGDDNGEMPNPWQAQLGAFIRAQRQLADLSLREMAALTRISNAYLSQVERGLHQPSLTVLRAIADGLGLTAEQLLAKAGWTQTGPAGGPRGGPDEGPDRVAPDTSASTGPSADTEDSIRRDPRLTEAQREALLGVYRSFIAGTSG